MMVRSGRRLRACMYKAQPGRDPAAENELRHKDHRRPQAHANAYVQTHGGTLYASWRMCVCVCVFARHAAWRSLGSRG